MVPPDNAILFSNKKKNKLLTYATTWMNLTNTMLKYKCQKKGNIFMPERRSQIGMGGRVSKRTD